MKEIICSNCGKLFKLKIWIYNNRKKASKSGRLFCCQKCARKINDEPAFKDGLSYKDQYNKYRKPFPEKYKAHNIVQQAIKNNKLIKPFYCEKCNKNKKLDAHHTDYSKPLSVIWVCHKCHMGVYHGKSI